MSLLAAYWLLGAFLVALAVLVLAARPGHRVNQALFALLVLEAAADVAFQYMRESTTAAEAVAWSRLGNWYFWPELPLMLFLVYALPDRLRLTPWRKAALAVVVALTVANIATLVLASPGNAAVDMQGPGRTFVHNTPWGWAQPGVLYAVALYAVQTGAVLMAAGWASSPTHTVAERRQGALCGLAFLALIGPTCAGAIGGFYAFFDNRAVLLAYPDRVLNLAWGLAALPLLALAVPRLAAPFEGRWRGVVLAAAAGPMLVVASWALDLWDPAALGLGNGRILWVALFATAFAVALVRFGVAGLGPVLQRRAERAAHAGLVLGAALVAPGVALLLDRGDMLPIGIALALAVGAVLLSPGPLSAPLRRAARGLLVHPEESTAMAQRARHYSAALERRLGPDGRLAAEDDTTLQQLRRELRITDREHALLLEALATRRAGTPQAQPALLGRYAVRRELGRGAFGTALLAFDPVAGRDVVLKRFHPGRSARRALAEARALKAVRHPRVLELLDVQEAGDEVFLVLAYAEGGSLAAVLKREGPLPPERAMALVGDVLDGLAALHAAGLVHRDVKPSNILLDQEGRALLGDFGAARFVEGSEGEMTMTGTDVLGSLVTVAPEVLRGEPPSPANDLYAAAAVLYRCLVGAHYLDLEGKNAFQARQAILHERPRLPHRRVPPALAKALAKGLAKEPRERYADAVAMREAVAAASQATVSRASRRQG